MLQDSLQSLTACLADAQDEMAVPLKEKHSLLTGFVGQKNLWNI